MGMTFKRAEQWLPPVDSDNVFVEIGSDRYEGSTGYFAELAVKNNTVLHTVDLSEEPQHRVTRSGPVSGIVWHQADGVEWSQTHFPALNKRIVCLYLDNFDYDWDVNRPTPNIEKQKQEYLDKFGIVMNNLNCQVAHLKQMIALLPHMNQKSIVVCDDTYSVNDCWIGKCGAVVTLLVTNGYEIVDADLNNGSSFGVILARH